MYSSLQKKLQNWYKKGYSLTPPPIPLPKSYIETGLIGKTFNFRISTAELKNVLVHWLHLSLGFFFNSFSISAGKCISFAIDLISNWFNTLKQCSSKHSFGLKCIVVVSLTTELILVASVDCLSAGKGFEEALKTCNFFNFSKLQGKYSYNIVSLI